MTSLPSVLLLLLLLLLLLIHSPVPSFYLASSSPRGVLFEEKTRLGSIPPSCHNKCNQCHPCMAVQVPTLPRQEADAHHHHHLPMEFYDDDPSVLNNKYTNYKPLGWKCRCNGHLYNP